MTEQKKDSWDKVPDASPARWRRRPADDGVRDTRGIARALDRVEQDEGVDAAINVENDLA